MSFVSFSVIVPTCRRQEYLARCLRSLELAATKVPDKKVEIIVTDDGGDDSAVIVNEFVNCNWTRGPGRGPAANRNHVARQAKGEWIAFIDEDCVADCGWLKTLVDLGRSRDIDVIEGKTVIPDKRDSPFLHGVENLTGGCYWSCNLAVRRKLFFDIGAFDEEFLEAGGEDMEFAWRMKTCGSRAIFAPQALVLHPQRSYTVRGFLRRVSLLKWFLLFLQKTGQSAPGNTSTPRILFDLSRRHLTFLLRQNWRSLCGKDGDGVRVRSFNMIWGWIVLPFQLPYLCFWELRFHRRLRNRTTRKLVVNE